MRFLFSTRSVLVQLAVLVALEVLSRLRRRDRHVVVSPPSRKEAAGLTAVTLAFAAVLVIGAHVDRGHRPEDDAAFLRTDAPATTAPDINPLATAPTGPLNPGDCGLVDRADPLGAVVSCAQPHDRETYAGVSVPHGTREQAEALAACRTRHLQATGFRTVVAVYARGPQDGFVCQWAPTNGHLVRGLAPAHPTA